MIGGNAGIDETRQASTANPFIPSAKRSWPNTENRLTHLDDPKGIYYIKSTKKGSLLNTSRLVSLFSQHLKPRYA